MVPAGSCRISRVPHYSGAALFVFSFRLQDFHLLRSNFPVGSTNFLQYLLAVLQPLRCRNIDGLGLCAFARHYLRNHFCFLFLRVLRCFSSPGSPGFMPYYLSDSGLPHSEIRAYAGICPWARLIAACHVLLRLREPRHPSCALFSFLYLLYSFRRKLPL